MTKIERQEVIITGEKVRIREVLKYHLKIFRYTYINDKYFPLLFWEQEKSVFPWFVYNLSGSFLSTFQKNLPVMICWNMWILRYFRNNTRQLDKSSFNNKNILHFTIYSSLNNNNYILDVIYMSFISLITDELLS